MGLCFSRDGLTRVELSQKKEIGGGSVLTKDLRELEECGFIRKDGVINLCEMKYTNEEYSLNSEEYNKIQNRLAQFQKVTEAKEAIHITLVCGNGYKAGKFSGIIQNVISGDDLFEV